MFTVDEKKIGNYNLIGTFLILIVFTFVVIMLSVSSRVDDFDSIEKDVKSKFLNDKKQDIKFKINNINTLIESLNQTDVTNLENNKKFMEKFIAKINTYKHNSISIVQFDEKFPYYEELEKDGEYYLYDKYFDEEKQKDIFTIEYLFLNKTFNWVISTKFTDNIMHQEINRWKKQLDTLILNNIYVHISLLFFFSIALLLVIYIINKVANKTIDEHKEGIKKRESDLQQTIHKLEQQVEDEIEKYENQKKIVQKQSKMLALGEMLANLSHQWRQPLNDISETARSIKSKIERHQIATDEDIDKLTHIHNSAQYLSKTVDDFKVFLKADSLKIDFNVTDIIEKALTINKTIIEKNNIKVIKNLDEDVMTHNLSFGLLQALVNIIYNSKDAMRNVAEYERFIFITTVNYEKSVEITLTDTGKGIPEEIIGSIFEPYFTTKQKTYGTGLGLHMAHNIIEQNMSGKITVTNKKFTYNNSTYIGASFTIILDINDQH
ncbi:MAG: HAMP domain-containing sensor histidine kinase [Arcobacteraceae bacterium]